MAGAVRRIGVDFDGTVVDNRFPEVGLDAPEAEAVLRGLSRAGHKIILNTMRHGEYLEAAVRWFHDREIPLYGVNQDPTQASWTGSPKVDADLYIDDKNIGCPLVWPEDFKSPVVDWKTIRLLFDLREQGKLFQW